MFISFLVIVPLFYSVTGFAHILFSHWFYSYFIQSLILLIFQTYYINESALSIPEHFSLQRTYVIFRTLGLRHLTVVDIHNEVVGIVTRKDLMGFSMVERLGQCMQEQIDREERGLEMMPPVSGD